MLFVVRCRMKCCGCFDFTVHKPHSVTEGKYGRRSLGHDVWGKEKASTWRLQLVLWYGIKIPFYWCPSEASCWKCARCAENTTWHLQVIKSIWRKTLEMPLDSVVPLSHLLYIIWQCFHPELHRNALQCSCFNWNSRITAENMDSTWIHFSKSSLYALETLAHVCVLASLHKNLSHFNHYQQGLAKCSIYIQKSESAYFFHS